MEPFHLPKSIGVAELIYAQTLAAGKNGINISLKNYQRCFLLCYVRAGAHAAQEVFTLAQSSGTAGGAAGTDEKALVASHYPRIYYCNDIGLTEDGGQDVNWSEATAHDHYQVDAVQSKSKIVIFDVIPEECLDIANGFDCLTVNTTGSDVAHIGLVLAFLVPRYAPPLSATID